VLINTYIEAAAVMALFFTCVQWWQWIICKLFKTKTFST